MVLTTNTTACPEIETCTAIGSMISNCRRKQKHMFHNTDAQEGQRLVKSACMSSPQQASQAVLEATYMAVNQGAQNGVPDVVLLSHTLIQHGQHTVSSVWSSCPCAVLLGTVFRNLQHNIPFEA